MLAFTPGMSVVYIKAGQTPQWNTEWPATYLRETPRGRHSIRLEGSTRVISVKAISLCLPKLGKTWSDR